MSWLEESLSRAAWFKRSAEFDYIGDRLEGPGIRLRQHGPLFDQMYELALKLPAHPAILEPIGKSWFRYPALDWGREIDDAATVGVELAQVYEFVLAHVRPVHRGWFASPIVKLDLEGELRVGFVAQGPHVAPEVLERWPHCDERALVYSIGSALRRFPSVHSVVSDCLRDSPTARYRSLRDLLEAFVAVGGVRRSPHDSRSPRDVWTHVERAIGYLELGDSKLAFNSIERAVKADANSPTSSLFSEQLREARHAISERAGRPDHVAYFAVRGIALDAIAGELDLFANLWREAEPRGLAMERAGRFDEALGLYERVREAGRDTSPSLDAALARVYYATGCWASAIERARGVLGQDPSNLEMLVLVANAELRMCRFAEALTAADVWIAIAPDDGAAHLARGKALEALGRMLDARDAYERASTRGPHMLEALTLRRELDKRTGSVREAAGTANPQTFDLPPHLADVRALLFDGRIRDAIEALHDRKDSRAQLLLGNLLAYEQRHAEALAIYDALLGEPAQRRAALDGRERALRALGRIEEADAAFAQLSAIAEQGSDLRVDSSR